MTTAPPVRLYSVATDEPGPAWRRAQDMLAAEWIKLRSLRPVYLICLGGVFATLLITALSAHTDAQGWNEWTPAQQAGFDALHAPFRGFAFAHLAFAVTGVLAIGSEYSSGLIRTTFTAMPARRAVLAAKATVLGLATFTVGLGTAATAFVIGQLTYAPHHFGVSIAEPEALGSIGAVAVYLSAVSLLGLALATLLRQSAVAITGCFVLLFLLSQFLHGDHGWMLHVHQAMPDIAIRRLTTGRADVLAPSRAAAWATILLYPAVALGAATVGIHRRDV
ncbi:ABC transporter permease [Kitasatospora paracochleata]